MQSTDLFHQYSLTPRTWDEMYDEERIRHQYQNVFDFLLSIPS